MFFFVSPLFPGRANPRKCYNTSISNSFFNLLYSILEISKATPAHRQWSFIFSLSLYLCLSWHKWSFDIDASNFVSLVIRFFLMLSLSISFNNILFVIRFSSKPISKLMSFWCCKFHSWLFFVYRFFALDLVLLLLQLRCCYWCVNILSTRICIDAIEVSFVNRIFMHKCRYRIQPSSIYSNEWFIDASKYMEQIQNFHWNETGRERGELYIRTANNMIKFKTNTANEPS